MQTVRQALKIYFPHLHHSAMSAQELLLARFSFRQSKLHGAFEQLHVLSRVGRAVTRLSLGSCQDNQFEVRFEADPALLSASDQQQIGETNLNHFPLSKAIFEQLSQKGIYKNK